VETSKKPLSNCPIAGSSIMPDIARFRFELDPLADVQPWGEAGRESLHWVGLTSGRYWIDTPLGEVLRYTAEIQKRWNYPFAYVDYYVARLFEDLQERLPAMLEPVPGDVAGIVSNHAWLRTAAGWSEDECDEGEIDDRWDLYHSALAWWQYRELDTGYLIHGPRLSFWCTGDDIHFRWSTPSNEDGGTSIYVVPTGYLRMSSASFQTAAHEFCQAVLSAMRERIEQIQQGAWNRIDCHLDVDRLAAEQRQREGSFAASTNRSLVTDWNQVRTQLKRLVERMGPVGAAGSSDLSR
jgi:hypothetical protein